VFLYNVRVRKLESDNRVECSGSCSECARRLSAAAGMTTSTASRTPPGPACRRSDVFTGQPEKCLRGVTISRGRAMRPFCAGQEGSPAAAAAATSAGARSRSSTASRRRGPLVVGRCWWQLVMLLVVIDVVVCHVTRTAADQGRSTQFTPVAVTRCRDPGGGTGPQIVARPQI